ncbi:hypothetical protein HPB49_014581 [Dermacentor silvarum]|uniref:Uncharacterized protein n=1 Tax=Dermacentor silvarum TaxID=543639 RepID=A0ACB8DJ90_DERSI|nr:hypothetical protein HPB49_014581 [Dermacentor silvarum]
MSAWIWSPREARAVALFWNEPTVEGSECMEACRFTRMRDLCHKHLEPGAACADLRGYCDVFQRCRLIDAEGPLAALRQLVFGRQGVPNALLEYWYVAAAGLVLSAVLTLAVIRACAVHVPSSNPRKCAQRKLSDTVRHPLDFIKDLVLLTR